MMINKITIKNFRSIKECTIDLQKYSLLVGANNVGKSNILKALQLFFSKEKPTVDDFCNFSNEKKINMSITINEKEISKEWKMNENKIVIVNTLDDEEKKLIENIIPIYIETIEKIEDITKTSSTNIFGKLLRTITESFENYEKYIKITELISEINNDKESPIKKLEKDLKNSLSESFKSNLIPSIDTTLKAQDIFKSINIKFKDEIGNVINTSDLGSGMQRTIIYKLIMLLNNTNPEKTYILLYDEPEVCLHPSQQKSLAFHLKHELSNQMQIILASHSSVFAISGIDQISSIIRTEFTAETKTYQIDSLDNTKEIYKSIDTNKVTTEYLDAYRYINWFNQERGQLFFAKKVLLVEGLTEKGLFDYLSENNQDWHFLQKNYIYILDCMGKFDIIRWGEIVKALNIPFGIIHDMDAPDIDADKKQHHIKMNTTIERLYEEQIIYRFEKDIEDFLDVPKGIKVGKDRKHHEHSILLYVDDNINIDALSNNIKKNIIDRRKNAREQLSLLCEKIKEYFEPNT